MIILSPKGDQFLKDNEESGEFSPEAYLDSVGIPTIGYGSTRINGMPVEMGMKINLPVAEALFYGEVRPILLFIARVVHVPLNQNQIDALVSFIYNIGMGGFSESSILKCINTHKPIVEDLFTRWNKGTIDGHLVTINGLTLRRKREYKLFMEKP